MMVGGQATMGGQVDASTIVATRTVTTTTVAMSTAWLGTRGGGASHRPMSAGAAAMMTGGHTSIVRAGIAEAVMVVAEVETVAGMTAGPASLLGRRTHRQRDWRHRRGRGRAIDPTDPG